MGSCWDGVLIKMSEGMLWGGLFGVILGFILGMKNKLTGPKLGSISTDWGLRIFALAGAAYGVFYSVKFCAIT